MNIIKNINLEKFKILNHKYDENTIHQIIISIMSNNRDGNSMQKNRSSVRGGGKKPWRQKGTGRARAGTIRSPLWRSGGVTFVSKNNNYKKKINKKMYKYVISSILSELYRRNSLIVIKSFTCDSYKTKDFIYNMHNINIFNALIILHTINRNEYLASRILKEYKIIRVKLINPIDLLCFKCILITHDALLILEENYYEHS